MKTDMKMKAAILGLMLAGGQCLSARAGDDIEDIKAEGAVFEDGTTVIILPGKGWRGRHRQAPIDFDPGSPEMESVGPRRGSAKEEPEASQGSEWKKLVERVASKGDKKNYDEESWWERMGDRMLGMPPKFTSGLGFAERSLSKDDGKEKHAVTVVGRNMDGTFRAERVCMSRYSRSPVRKTCTFTADVEEGRLMSAVCVSVDDVKIEEFDVRGEEAQSLFQAEKALWLGGPQARRD